MWLLLSSCPVMSDSFWPQGLQHGRPLCPPPSPEVCPSSCPLHWWCHPAISSSDTLFSFCPQSVPASGTFPMSQLFTSDDQNTGVSASASVLPTNIQGWFLLRLTFKIDLKESLKILLRFDLQYGTENYIQYHVLTYNEKWKKNLKKKKVV